MTINKLFLERDGLVIGATQLVASGGGINIGGTLAVDSSTYIQGSIGIGTGASGVSGEIRCTNNITAYYTSDINLKENISTLTSASEKIKQIRGVEFDWKENFVKEHGGEDGYFVRKHDVGVIAQEIEKVLPEAVGTRGDNTLAVRYEKIIPLLIEAIKEQQIEIENLKKKIG